MTACPSVYKGQAGRGHRHALKAKVRHRTHSYSLSLPPRPRLGTGPHSPLRVRAGLDQNLQFTQAGYIVVMNTSLAPEEKGKFCGVEHHFHFWRDLFDKLALKELRKIKTGCSSLLTEMIQII